MPIFDSTLLTIRVDGECINMWTHSRKHPRSWAHLIYKIDLEYMLWKDKTSLLDTNSGSLLEIQKKDENTLRFSFTWLHTYRGDCFTGWHDTVEVSLPAIKELLSAGDGSHHFMHIERREPVSFDFTHSQHVIATIIDNKRRKRAFCKGMRDSLAYLSGTFRMYGDTIKHSFYFVAERGGQKDYNGGYILSTMRKHTPIGTVEVPVYQRHT